MKKFYVAFLKNIGAFLSIACFLLLPGSLLLAQTVTVTNPSSPWTVPTGVTSIKVEVWGGGGGGGGAFAGSGGGGGGGAYNTQTITVIPVDSYTITYGAGGVGISSDNGADGGTTTFVGPGGSVNAVGGKGGGVGLLGPGNGGLGGVGAFNGGDGGTSVGDGAGGGGGAGNNGNGVAGDDTFTGTGGAGTPYAGGDGGAFITTPADGNPGAAPGGGGGGSLNTGGTQTGGNGGDGQVVITYTLPINISGFSPSSGCANTTPVIITGTGFTGATAVTFGGTNAASFTVNSDNQITATPAAGTTGTIQLTAPTGSVTSVGTFTINLNPTANAGGALAAICQNGTSAAMGGSVGGGATGGTWSGGAGTWTNANDPVNATYKASASESGTITLTLTTSGGSCGTTTATKTIVVNQNPTANAGTALAAICQGATSAAMGGSVGGGATGGTWTGGAGIWTNANDPANATYTAGAAESGTITLTLTTSGGSCGTTTDTKTIVVNQNPTANAGGALAAVCQGGTSAAMGGSVGGGATGGTWTGGAGTWTNANDPANATYTAGAAESGTITLTLTTTGGSCGTTTATKTIVVNQNPTANAGAALAAICQGGTSAAMGGSVGGGATGGTWSGGAGTWTNANNPATATYKASASESGTITLTLTTSGGLCGITTATKTITVNQNPTANAGAALAAICQGGTSAAMGGSVGGGATGGTWTGGAGTWSNAINPATATYTAGAAESGTITLTLTTTGGSCGTTTATKTIVVNQNPTANAGGALTAICQGGTSAAMGGSVGGGATGGTWTGGAGTWTNAANPATATYKAGAAESGTITLTLTTTGGSCGTTTATKTIVVNQNPTANAGGALAAICQGGTSAAMGGSVGGGATGGTWTGGAGTWTNAANSATATYKAGAAESGTITLTLTTSGGSCGTTTATKTIVVNQNPTANAGGALAAVCQGGTSAAMGGSVGGGATGGTWTGGAGTWTNAANPATATYKAGAAESGTITLTLTTTGGSCGTTTATKTIVVNQNPTANAGGALAAICQGGTSAAMGGSVGGGATGGTWTGGAGTWTNAANPATATYKAGAAESGTITLTLTTTGGSCGTTTATKTIVVNQNPTANAGGALAAICQGGTSAAMGGSVGGGATGGIWSGGAGTWTNANNPATATYTAGAAESGAITLTLTSSGGLCGTTTATKTITVNKNPTANAGGALAAICQGGTSAAMGGSVGGGATGGTWTGGAGTWTNAANPATATYKAGAAESGTITLTLTTTGGSCGTTTATKTIVVNQNPTANAGGALAAICQGGTSAAMGGSVGGGATGGIWSGGAGTWTNANNPATATYTAGAAESGAITLTLTSSGGLCGTTTATKNITVNKNPTANAGGALAAICQGATSAAMGGSVGGGATGGTWTGGAGTWTNAANPATATYKAGAAESGTITLTLTTSGGSCGTTTATKTITVNSLPTVAGISGVSFVCSGSASTYTDATSGGVWSIINGTGTATITGGGILTGGSPGSVTVSYKVTNASGCSTTATMSVTINSLPTPTLTNSPVSPVCANTNVTYTTDPGQSNYVWTFTGTAGIDYTLVSGGNSTSNTAVVSWITPGTKTVTANYNNGNGCTAATPTSNSITVLAVPTGSVTVTENSGISPNDNIICAGGSVTYTAPSGNNSYTFYVNGVKVQGPNSANTYSTTSLNNGDVVTVSVANGNNCGTTFTAPSVAVNPLPTPTLNADKLTICAGDNITFTATGGTGYNFKVNGSSVQSGLSATYSSTALTNGASVTVDVTNANGCLATSAPVVITVNALPSGTLSALPTTICLGASVTATATAGFSNYNFKVNGVSVQNSALNTFTSTTLTNGNVITVDVINASGCTTSFGPPQVITVKALPSGTLTATENSGTPNDNIICAGSTVTFTASAGFTNYKFSINGGAPVQNSASNVYTNSTLANGDIVSVLVTSAGGCAQTFNTVSITVNPLPAGTLTASANPICSGDNIDFTADAGYTNYNFKVNGVSFQNGSSNTASRSGFTNGDIVTVDVSNAAGCIATFNSLTITVNGLPTGALSVSETSGNGPNDGVICTGATVTFTANSGFSNYNFKINNITVQFGAANIFVTNTLANGDVVSVEVTNASGCVATFNTFTITVNTIPPVSPITGPAVVCANSTITLADVTTGGVWGTSDAGVATVNSSGDVTGVSAGVATISYKVTNAGGCDSTVTKNVTVNAVPVVSPITGTFSVCVGSTTQLSDATAPGTWSSSDNGIATVDVNGLVKGVSSGTVTISYSVTNGNGCTTTVIATVTVNDVPVVASITGTLSVCVNATTTLADGTLGGTWSSSDNAVATVNGSGVVTGKSAGTATISYSVTNLSGCNTTVTADVTVNPLPVPTLSGPNPICPNSTDTYTTEAGQSNYAWNYTGGSLVSGGTTSDNTITIKWNLPGARTISVNYQNSFGCSGATSATVLTSTGTVPTLTGSNPVCLNSDGTYATQPGFANYTWTATGGTIAVGTPPNDNTATVTWTTAGTGSVSINFTDANGCTAVTPTVFPVVVHNLPTATITGNTTVCQNAPTQQVTFTGASGTAPYTFTYNDGTGNQSVTTTAGNSITVPVSTGTAGAFTYTLISVSDNNSCSQNQSGSVTVTVNPLATGTVSGTTSVCNGSPSPDVTFAGTLGTAPFTFKYNINGGATQTVTTISGNSITVSASTGTAGTFTYNLLSVSDANGCLNPQTGSAVITVNPLPTAGISGTTSVCLNAISPNITFTGAAGTAPYTFTYNINGGGNLTVTSVGNTATVPVPTTVAGTFIYNLVSVQDASSTLCSQGQAGSATITVNPTSVGGTVTSNATVCSGTNTGTLTLSGQTGNVTRWESSIDGGATWVPIANTTTSLTYNNITQNTQYRAVVQSGACSSANSIAAIITVNPVSVGGTISANQTICSGITPANLTLSGNTGSVVKWQRATDAAFATAVDIANTTTTLTGAAIGALATTTYFRAVVQSGTCAPVNSATAIITVNPLPTATISGTANVCQNAPAPNITFTGANGTAPYTFTYKINAGGNLNVTSVGNVATVVAPTTTVGTFTYTLISVKDASSTTCSQNQSGTAVVTVNAPPPAFIITPASATICLGGVQSLLASGNTPTSGSVTFNSGNINLAIPDDGAPSGNTGAVSTIAVSGIPAGAVINSVSVLFNITHTADGELKLNITAPNTNTLNMVNTRGGNGNNFTNTIISSASINPVSGAAAPFTGTYSPDAAFPGVGALGFHSNVGTFSSLYATPNGNWTFSAEDVQGCVGIFCPFFGTDNTGTINNWSITINYTVPISPLAVTWSPVTDLFTDPGAISAYTGTSVSTVYSKPSTSGSRIYTATATNATGCSTSQNVTLTVNPSPVVTITANYCAVPGKVQLTANSVPVASSYLWSTGETTQIILVDVSDVYTVTAFSALSCPGSATINVAQELVVNGDFESGGISPNTVFGFTSDYSFKPDLPGLVPAGQGELYDDSGNNGFSITPNGQNVHTNFWGHDHTTSAGGGNFMAVNGHGNTLVVWKETVNVLPNTTYYFSAWAMSLNSSGNNATLQFSVNGTLVGTTAALANHNQDNNRSSDNWARFYGTWTSGPTTTTAQIYINDLQSALGGNDFGLDDISFATLSTFIDLESAPGTDAQTICVNTPLTNIVYSVGNGNPSGPTVTGLPAGVTSVFAGDKLTFSGTPTVAGNYTYTITTTGCAPYSVTGTITVQAQKLTLTSGSASPTVCINTALTNIVYTASGPVTNVTVTGLPTGVTGNYVAGTKTFTISGSPSVPGVFKDTVITTGTCKTDTAYGTITVQNQTITLSSGPATQIVCINDAITSVVYTVGGTATGAGVVGLPTGVTGFYSGGSFIISGTPAVAGTFNFTVTTTGTCNPGAVATGTITVNPAASIVLSSLPGTDAQTICINTAIVDITYTTGGTATGASITSGALPAGVTGSFSGGVFTVTGTPTVAGIFNYTITATGTCAQVTISGSITVQSQTIVLTSGNASPTLCMGSTLTNIVYTIGGTATGAVLTGSLPTGITGVYDVPTKTFTISGSPSQLGTFNYTVTTTGGCSPGAALNGTIIVNNGSVGGTVTPSIPAICSGGGGILNLLGQTGNVVHWESSTDGGTTWVNIANTTTTLNYLAVTVPTQYRVLVKSGSCTGVYSSIATVAIHNYWVGGDIGNPTDWNTAANWSDNLVPSTICADVYIPNTVNKPVLSGGPTSTITNLHILAGAQVTINGTGLMQVGGTISNAGTFDVSNGAIEFNGTSVQTIAANTFLNNAVHDVIISNSAGTGVTLGGALNVYRSLTYNKNGAILNTAGLLTLKSTATETAWVGDMTGHTINGDVTVERYVATGTTGAPNHGKSWQLLAVPTQGQTIKASWQEGATAANVGLPAGSNPNPGYGTMITSDVAGAATQPSPGFDAFTSPGPSVKVYDYTTALYVGPPNTNLTQVYNQKGYFVFVRGDRSVYTSGGAANPTILRTKGTLFTTDPAHLPPTTTVFAGKFESVGNPYASAIDMRNITLGGGTQKFFIVWDPRLGGAYNYGAFQTFSLVGGNYTVTPGGGTYGPAGSVNNYIQSGQAFFVQAFGIDGTVSFAESCKAGGSVLFTTPNPVNQVVHTLRTSLNTVNADGTTGSIVDGVLNQFDDTYSNAVDGMDARKMINTGENLGIKTGGKLLSIETRHTVTQQDTIFLNITSERVQPYRFHFDAENLDPSVQGYLADNYTKTRTPLNMTGTTDVDFTVAAVTGSNAAGRFMIVFEPLKALPVTFTSIKAYRQDKNINVEWRVDNEVNMKQYVVEKSTDGSKFTGIAQQKPTANNGGSAVYVSADANPVTGFNYYRVKSTDINGKISYTNVVKVLVGTIKQDITIYPNPITDGMIHLQFLNEPAGKYNIRLLNKLGQVILQQQVTRADGNGTELIKWDYNLAHGMYQLEITRPDSSVKDINVMY